MNKFKPSKLSKFLGNSLLALKPFVDQSFKQSTRPFSSPEIIKPRQNEKYYSWSHYGIFLPDLPEPHRYLNIMILLGTPSARAFDHDQLILNSPRHTATFFSSTAAMPQALLKAYNMQDECELKEDNSLIKLGDDIQISGQFPKFKVKGNYLNLSYDLELDVSEHVSWFLKNPIYDHLSLLTQVKGELKYQDEMTQVDKLCTYEYARSLGLHSLQKNKLIPAEHKIPLNFFTYQIINLDEKTQILLTKADLNHRPAAYTVHIRYLDRPAEVYEHVSFEVTRYQDKLQVSPTGNETAVPDLMRWQAWDNHQNKILDIEAQVDSPYHYGHGNGYATHYAFKGFYLSNTVQGRGYMEYVDL